MGLLDAIAGIFSTRTDSQSKPPFIIEVARTQPSAGLRLKDLLMTHPACGGGKFVPFSDDAWIDCQRCHVTIHLNAGEHSIGAIFQTAFDGERRTVNAHHIPDEYSEVFVQKAKD